MQHPTLRLIIQVLSVYDFMKKKKNKQAFGVSNRQPVKWLKALYKEPNKS